MTATPATASPLVDRLASATLVHMDARVVAFHLLGTALDQTDEIFTAVRDGVIQAQTSTLTLYQVLAELYRRGDAARARDVALGLQVHPGLEMIACDADISIQAAEVRAQLGGRPERAVQIATALLKGAEIYLTTGSGLRRLAGMTVLNVEDFAANG